MYLTMLLEHLDDSRGIGRLGLFNSALGEMRGVFGIHLGRIAVAYGVYVHDEPAEMLPAELD